MKRLVSGSIFLLAITLLASGCGNTEPEGPFSRCITYESDGLMYMECPLDSLLSVYPTRKPYKYSNLGRYQAQLSACPVSPCYKNWCWSLCETTNDLCIYSARPQDRPAAPGAVEKTPPVVHLTD